eukprot:scaffold43853_cov59-Phaeocystis_antarctica.AAC.1
MVKVASPKAFASRSVPASSRLAISSKLGAGNARYVFSSLFEPRRLHLQAWYDALLAWCLNVVLSA